MIPADDNPRSAAAEDPVERLRQTIQFALTAIDELTAKAFRLHSVAAVELVVGTALKVEWGQRVSVKVRELDGEDGVFVEPKD